MNEHHRNSRIRLITGKNTKIMHSKQKDYHSYLLRLWRVREGEGESWRASLQEVETGDLLGFAELDELFDYLEGLQDQASDQTRRVS